MRSRRKLEGIVHKRSHRRGPLLDTPATQSPFPRLSALGAPSTSWNPRAPRTPESLELHPSVPASQSSFLPISAPRTPRILETLRPGNPCAPGTLPTTEHLPSPPGAPSTPGTLGPRGPLRPLNSAPQPPPPRAPSFKSPPPAPREPQLPGTPPPRSTSFLQGAASIPWNPCASGPRRPQSTLFPTPLFSGNSASQELHPSR